MMKCTFGLRYNFDLRKYSPIYETHTDCSECLWRISYWFLWDAIHFIKKAEHWRINAFKLLSWRRLLRVPWTARRSSSSILEEINPECSLEGPVWSWGSNTLAFLSEEPTLWKRHWYWEKLKEGGEGGNRRHLGWMASLTEWTWVWATSWT